MTKQDAENKMRLVTMLLTKANKENSEQILSILNDLINNAHDHISIKINAYVKRARHIHEYNEDFDKAIADYNAVISLYYRFKDKKDLNPSIRETLSHNYYYANLRMGAIYGKLGEYNKSSGFLGVAIKSPYYKDKSNYEYGKNYLRMGNFNLARMYFNFINKDGEDNKCYYLGMAQVYNFLYDEENVLKIIEEGIAKGCLECYSCKLTYYLRKGYIVDFLELMGDLHDEGVIIPNIYIYYENLYSGTDYQYYLTSEAGYNLLQHEGYDYDRAFEHILLHSSPTLTDPAKVWDVLNNSSMLLKNKECIPSFDVCDSYNLTPEEMNKFWGIDNCTEYFRVVTILGEPSKVLTIFPISPNVKTGLVRKCNTVRTRRA